MTVDPLVDRDCLVAELGVLRARLRMAARDTVDDGPDEIAEAETALADCRTRRSGPTPLDLVAEGFGLSEFERAVLLLAAGPDLVAAVRDELLAASGHPRTSFGLALTLLPSAHWDATTPVAPLRRWRLVDLTNPISPIHSPLLVGERVLHYLVGAGHIDVELAAMARSLPAPSWLPAPLDAVADEVAGRWGQERAVLLHGPQPANLRAVAAAAAARSGLRMLALRAADLPADATERSHLLRGMERETVLLGCAWAVDLAGTRPEDVAGLAWALAGLEAPVVVLGDGADAVPAGPVRLTSVVVPRLDLPHRRDLLEAVLRRHEVSEDLVSNEDIDTAVGVFDLDIDATAEAVQEVTAGRTLWEACRRTGRTAFSGLARVVAPRASWDDLVVPDPQLAQLRALVAGLRHHRTVLDDWGYGTRTRGLGTTALFAGPSGTGKTLAGEVVAGAVGLDLVHVDISQVVNKYIGETEKNLRRLFDAAEDAGAVLLFDEADTLFGRRSEVSDSHDRYANLEIGYLLQRMEEFRGLAILTTNDRSALDPAFLRRLRFIVSFPYPTPDLRETLWRVAIPSTVPTHGVEVADLAGIDLPGGGIAAAALTAAYLAAEDSGPVRAEHVRLATQWELAKTGRLAPPQQLTGR